MYYYKNTTIVAYAGLRVYSFDIKGLLYKEITPYKVMNLILSDYPI